MKGAGNSCRGRRGFMFADAMVGLAIASVLLLAVGMVIVQQSRAERKLAEVRREMRMLETALLELQTTGKRTPEVDVDILRDAAPAGYRWARVSKVSTSGQLRSIMGLVQVRFEARLGAENGGEGHE